MIVFRWLGAAAVFGLITLALFVPWVWIGDVRVGIFTAVAGGLTAFCLLSAGFSWLIDADDAGGY